MINIITQSYKRQITREYWLRVGVVGLTLLTGVLIIGSVLLVPSLLVTNAKVRVLSLEQTDANAEYEKALASELAAVEILNSQALVLLQSEKQKKVSPLLQTIVTTKPSGISISALSYERDPSGKILLKLSGNALYRENLVQFKELLEEQELFSVVDVPISNFAQNQDIVFTITLTVASS